MIKARDLATLGMLAAVLLPTFSVEAIKDKTNQGRWTKPTVNNVPDKEVPGFLVNLGPTGARAILTDTTKKIRRRRKIDAEVDTTVFMDAVEPVDPHR